MQWTSTKPLALIQSHKITTVKPRQLNRIKAISGSRTHIPTNCVYIDPSTTPCKSNQAKETSRTAFVPSILLSNVMSLAPKIDEVRHYAEYANLDLVCLTETWLQDHIHDNIVDISGFNLLRRDRKEGTHGGVCMFVRDNIRYSLLDFLDDPSFEVLWVKIRPNRLPRGFSSIIVGIVYHPPSSNDLSMLNYQLDCFSTIESRYPNSGILLLGDFNKLNVSRLKSSYKLKQIVNFQPEAATR